LSAKRRIFQVAKEFNVSNDDLIGFFGKLHFEVHGPNTTVSDEMYDKVAEKYRKSPVVVPDDAQDFRKRIKEKKFEEEEKKGRLRKELEERMRVAKVVGAEVTSKAKARTRTAAKPAEPAPAEAKATPGKTPRRPDKIEPSAKPRDEVKVKKPGVVKPVESKPTLQETIAALIPQEDLRKPTEVKTPSAPPTKAKSDDKGIQTVAKRRRKRRRGHKPRPEAILLEARDDLANVTLPQKDLVKPSRKGKKRKKRKISEEEIQESIRQTIAAMEGSTRGRPRRRRVREEAGDTLVEVDEKLKVPEFISVADLAHLMEVEPSEVIQKCLGLGLLVSINQRLDADTIVAVTDEFDYQVEIAQEYGADLIEEEEIQDLTESLRARPPVVTIMGHVDHGKTSLLDYIRESNVVAGESGGITQHIGAYEVEFNSRHITFLDTPGHEAFTAMRARGAQATDIVILVVAADDGVQQQTIEAINHARAANVPIVVAINKLDKPGANPDQIRQQLSQHGILLESWGGKVQSAEVSAKTGKGVDHLLELVLLEADLLDLKANPDRPARGVIIESELDRGKGAIATVLVQKGALHIGEAFIAGHFSGKVRAMYDERGKRVSAAPPSTPVRVVGFSGVPAAGDQFVVMTDERAAREISQKRLQLKREQDFRKVRHITLDQISKQIKEGAVKELQIIVKGDVDGSVEAISDSLMKLSTNEVAVHVIHKAVGGISESDVLLAAASEAIILGFHVRSTLKAREIAERENVDIRLYKIIYDAVNDVKSALEGLLEPEISENIAGTVEIRELFKVPKVGTVAGCYVQSGKLVRNDNVRLYREDKLIFEGKLGSLKRFKDDVREVTAGFECGLSFENFDDLRVGDVVEAVQIVKTKRTL
jgi:translation initiation factor IF-2